MNGEFLFNVTIDITGREGESHKHFVQQRRLEMLDIRRFCRDNSDITTLKETFVSDNRVKYDIKTESRRAAQQLYCMLVEITGGLSILRDVGKIGNYSCEEKTFF